MICTVDGLWCLWQEMMLLWLAWCFWWLDAGGSWRDGDMVGIVPHAMQNYPFTFRKIAFLMIVNINDSVHKGIEIPAAKSLSSCCAYCASYGPDNQWCCPR